MIDTTGEQGLNKPEKHGSELAKFKAKYMAFAQSIKQYLRLISGLECDPYLEKRPEVAEMVRKFDQVIKNLKFDMFERLHLQ